MASPRFAAATDVRVCIFDDEAVVFNPFSWETHLLTPAAAIVLESVASMPCREDGVRDILAEVLDEQERPRAAEHAHRLLRELTDLRLLVELAPGSDEGR